MYARFINLKDILINMMRKVFVLLLALFISISLLPVSLAEHTVDHRYWLEGHVEDTDGNPVQGIRVSGIHVKSGEKNSAVTNGDGYYKFMLHIHNTDLGDIIEVDTAGQKEDVTITFDPNNNVDDRVSTVDFTIPSEIAAQLSEQNSLDILGVLGNAFLFIGLPIMIFVLGYFLISREKDPRRPISRILGIGRSKEAELKKIGIKYVEELAEADASHLSENTSLSLKEAKNLIKRANEETQS